jgi:hypothetical protein
MGVRCDRVVQSVFARLAELSTSNSRDEPNAKRDGAEKGYPGKGPGEVPYHCRSTYYPERE